MSFFLDGGISIFSIGCRSCNIQQCMPFISFRTIWTSTQLVSFGLISCDNVDASTLSQTCHNQFMVFAWLVHHCWAYVSKSRVVTRLAVHSQLQAMVQVRGCFKKKTFKTIKGHHWTTPARCLSILRNHDSVMEIRNAICTKDFF